MKQFKLPTLLGVLILFLLTGTGVFLVQNQKKITSSASPSITPEQVKITNLTDRNFTISWFTDKPIQGFVTFGSSKSVGTVISENSPSQIHYITIENLKPSTIYYFKIGSGKDIFDNNGLPYETKTGPTISTLPDPDIIFGDVATSSGSFVPRAIVYITAGGIAPISALTNTNGRWTIPLSTTRSATLQAYATYDKNKTLLDIRVQTSEGKNTSVKVYSSSAHPVPTITIGQNQDFTNIQKPVNEKINAQEQDKPPTSQINFSEETDTVSGFETKAKDEKSTKPVKINLLNPIDSIVEKKPKFSGTGTPGTSFTIKVKSSTVYSGSITVNEDGGWEWTPPKNLEPGNHTVTLIWKDETGETKTIKQEFTLLGIGTNPSSSASPKVSPSPPPQISPSPRASLAPVGGPTAGLTTPSPKVSPKPTSSPAAFQAPVAGDLTVTIGVFIMGIVLVLIGLFVPKTKTI